jgi:hypothetical protein
LHCVIGWSPDGELGGMISPDKAVPLVASPHPSPSPSRRAEAKRCWLCGRPLGRSIEYHHPVPKSRGGRETVPIHPICHRTLHRTFSNAELGVFGDSAAAIRADPRIGRFLVWIQSKDPDFHAPTHRKR